MMGPRTVGALSVLVGRSIQPDEMADDVLSEALLGVHERLSALESRCPGCGIYWRIDDKERYCLCRPDPKTCEHDWQDSHVHTVCRLCRISMRDATVQRAHELDPRRTEPLQTCQCQRCV